MSIRIDIFDMADPEDRRDAETRDAACRLLDVIWDLDQWLRNEIKHAQREELQPALEMLRERLRDQDLNLEWLMRNLP